MEKITELNFDRSYIDPIERQQIKKFVCDEMSRQIHRYIKGMSGSKSMMMRFENQLTRLDIDQKMQAIARYIDLNRKATAGLDFKIVLTRAIANYCDTYSYFVELMSDENRVGYYLHKIKEDYIQYHTIFEENGKFGIKDHQGRVLLHAVYDFLRTPYIYVDDLKLMPVIAEKDKKMGLVLPDGNDTVVADFIYDDISLRDKEPYFEARKGRETILIG